jgi:hypothetical protein
MQISGTLKIEVLCMKRKNAYSVLIGVLGASLGIGENVGAVQTKPPTNVSWYISSTSATETNQSLYIWLYNKGFELGQRDLNQQPGIQDTATILHFGCPVVQSGVYGASGYGRFLNTAVINEATKQYALGYYYGTGANNPGAEYSYLRIVVGTSNSKNCNVTYAHGQAWSQMVRDVGDWLAQAATGDKVQVRGGIDAETDTVSFTTAGPARNWVDGYTSIFVSPYWLYDFGDAGGCPQSGTTSTPKLCLISGQSSSLAWSQEDVYYVSYGAAPSVPMPQIYSTGGGNARSWQQISLYSYLRYGFRIEIAGPLSQSGACGQPPGCATGTNNTSTQAWTQLWTELNNNVNTAQDLLFSADIKWRYRNGVLY